MEDKKKAVLCALGGAAVGAAAAVVAQRAATPKVTKYTPPKVWEAPMPESENGNRSTAGVRTQKPLPKGEHPLQLYSLGTPNGVKVTILLEELCDLYPEFEYDAFLIHIMKGTQFTSGFVSVNPNSKIPALVDNSNPEKPINVFESGAILMHLAENHGGQQFLPTEPAARAKCLSWLFWQMGSAPYLGGGFGHFYAYAKEKQEYPINRFAMESKRQLDVLNRQLANSKFIAGDEYTLADIAIWPWYGNLVLGRLYNSEEFLNVKEYTNVIRWANEVWKRPAVKRGRMVNRSWGPENTQLAERHSREDFKGKTWDE